MVFRNILVPTDFGPPARRALELAIDLGERYGSNLTILHAFMLPVTGYDESVVWPFEDFEREAQRALDAEVAWARGKFPRVEGVLRSGVPWEIVTGYVTKHPVDLVVMGTTGRKGLARALLGSVADKVVRLSHVPVLATPAAPSP